MKKILTLLIILTIAISCLSIVSADNNTTNDTLETAQDDNITEDNITEDNANYILITSISGNLIKFSDGFSGFCIDSGKADLSTDDKFTPQATGGGIENYMKLAIIECYKQKRENDIGTIMASFADGSYASSSDEVIKSVLNSGESIGDSINVKIDNTTEATFNFELLKSANNEKSDCLGYTVSLETVENEDVLAASNDDANAVNNDTDNTTKTTENNTDNTTKTTENNTDKKSNNETESGKENKTSKDNETMINETNKTIINKTNTVIINQNNTTTITQKNIKHINNTTVPHKETPQEKFLKTVGNPIFILIVVIAIIAIVTFTIKRKG